MQWQQAMCQKIFIIIIIHLYIIFYIIIKLPQNLGQLHCKRNAVKCCEHDHSQVSMCNKPGSGGAGSLDWMRSTRIRGADCCLCDYWTKEQSIIQSQNPSGQFHCPSKTRVCKDPVTQDRREEKWERKGQRKRREKPKVNEIRNQKHTWAWSCINESTISGWSLGPKI